MDQDMDRLLIVDFGSQVTQLIARRVRESGVYCEIVPFHSASEKFAEIDPRAVILSGGPNSVADTDTPRIPENILAWRHADIGHLLRAASAMRPAWWQC